MSNENKRQAKAKPGTFKVLLHDGRIGRAVAKSGGYLIVQTQEKYTMHPRTGVPPSGRLLWEGNGVQELLVPLHLAERLV